MAQKPRQPTASLVRTTSPVLVGRGSELHALRDTVVRQPAVVMIDGEAGVGKSRLVRELLTAGDLGPLQVLLGTCQPLREPFPYGAVLEALRGCGDRMAHRPPLSRVTGVLSPLLPELADLLPEAPAPSGDPRSDRHRLFRAVRELLAATGPVLMVIEDLHWADDGSRQLLRFLMADPPPTLSILVTYRREDVPGGMPLGTAYRPPAGITSLLMQLDPLDADGVRSLASAILDEDTVSGEFAAKLHERTAGIPFVVEETLRALRNPAGAVHADGATARRLLENAEVPVLLRDAMAERLAGLPIAATRLTQAAAVLGVPAPAEVLGEVAGIGEQRVRAALGHALAGHVLHEAESGRYTFRHQMAQDAVYDTLSGPDRQQLHLRAIAALERAVPRPLLQLAEHSRRADRVEDWLRYGEAAADRATEVGDAATATSLLQRLLTEPALSVADIDRLAIKLGQVAHTGLDQLNPVATLRKLLADRRLSTSARGEVRLFLGLLLIRQAGGLEIARTEIELAIADLAERPDLAARGTAVLGQPFIGDTPRAEFEPWLRRTEVLIETTDDVELRIALMANNLGSRMHTGDPAVADELDRLPRSAETPSAQRQLARVNCNIADASVCVGHFARAEDYLRTGLRLADDCGAPFVVSTARATKVRLDWFTGEWTGLAERAGRLLDEYRDLLPVASELCLVLGGLAAARGEWAEALSYFTETGAYAPQESIAQIALGGCAGLARTWLAQDELVKACADVDRGLALLRRKNVWAWALELVPVAVSTYLRAGRDEDAARVVEETAAGVAGKDAPMAAAAVDSCRGELAEAEGDIATAVEYYQQAQAAYEKLNAPYYAAMVAERQALCLLPTDGSGAAAQLSTLIDAYDGLGATRDAARCRHLLRGVGGVKPSRRGRRGYGNELSPREHEVARLLAGGHTNREIADVLFLSPRTVEQHAARVLRKLGVTSRAELQAEDFG
ncbi:helix-turn-helix transcriptional regulator [Actinokineospora sp. HUAS TT18]|uniref:helix-turn-helix transcriptional regulator n=1 Tax=Actinokineospora sp. HUAS TT18 TaxID=3447451 RepID=UPI003F51BEE3